MGHGMQLNSTKGEMGAYHFTISFGSLMLTNKAKYVFWALVSISIVISVSTCFTW